MYNTALFDLDGMVLDTESLYTVCCKRIGEVYKPGVPILHILSRGGRWLRYSVGILKTKRKRGMKWSSVSMSLKRTSITHAFRASLPLSMT